MKVNLIEFVLREISQIQGEIILNKAMISEHDEKIEEAFEKGDILVELLAIKEQAELRNNFFTKISYLEGKVDAYIKLLKEIGFEI